MSPPSDARPAHPREVTMSQPAEILIVDDDPGMLETLGDVLDHAGYHVDTAEQGHAGLERVILDPPIDLAIVDFKLPDVSGLDVLRSIKTRSASTEVILMSGYASLASVLEAMEGQAASYVVKPFDFLQLRAMVARTLSRQRVARALRESEQHHRLVVDAMSDPAFLLDVDGSILLGN